MKWWGDLKYKSGGDKHPEKKRHYIFWTGPGFYSAMGAGPGIFVGETAFCRYASTF